jgi:hypothetical protein
MDSPTGGGGKGEEGENNMDSPTLNDSRQKFRNDKMQGRQQNAGTNTPPQGDLSVFSSINHSNDRRVLTRYLCWRKIAG